MAAIIETHPSFIHTGNAQRPLRLVTLDGRRVDRSASATTPAVLVALVLALLLVVVGAIIVGRGGLADLAPAPPVTAASNPAFSAAAGSSQVVTVRSGDTLWSIARRIRPTGDVRPLVDQLVASHPAALQPGERLTISS